MSVSIVKGKGGLPMVSVQNEACTAEIMLLGAHLISFVPAKSSPLIWMSKASRFEDGVPIRGGIPLCWPWFGKHSENPETMPMHGFVRHLNWEFGGAVEEGPAKTVVTLTFKDTPETRKLWNYAFQLEAIFSLGEELSVELKTTNRDDKPFVITQGIHTYFDLADIEAISILGFDNTEYFNKVGGANNIKRMPAGPFQIREEVDGVFKKAPGPFEVVDPLKKRTIHIQTQGSNSAVIWNPWKERSKVLPDYTPDAYQTMVCVETCNAMEDAQTVQPGTSFSLKATYTIQQK